MGHNLKKKLQGPHTVPSNLKKRSHEKGTTIFTQVKNSLLKSTDANNDGDNDDDSVIPLYVPEHKLDKHYYFN